MVTLTNTGSFGVNVTQARVVGDDAAELPIVDDDCSGRVVTEGGSCSIVVRFAPSATGPRAAVLEVNEVTTDAPRSPHTVVLRGVGGRRP